MFVRLLLVCSISLLLTNCANMNQSDCLTADWRLIGFEDGSLGRNESTIAQHRKECAKHGVTPDLAAYRQGHVQGSEIFCTQNNGFIWGKAGKTYHRSCPARLESVFLIGFNDGQTLYALKKVLNHHTQVLENTYSRIDWLEITMAEKSDQMIADGLNRQQRKIIRDQIAQHQQQHTELLVLLPDLQQNFEDALAAHTQGQQQYANYIK